MATVGRLGSVAHCCHCCHRGVPGTFKATAASLHAGVRPHSPGTEPQVILAQSLQAQMGRLRPAMWPRPLNPLGEAQEEALQTAQPVTHRL